jgi:hypothetical protein
MSPQCLVDVLCAGLGSENGPGAVPAGILELSRLAPGDERNPVDDPPGGAARLFRGAAACRVAGPDTPAATNRPAPPVVSTTCAHARTMTRPMTSRFMIASRDTGDEVPL